MNAGGDDAERDLYDMDEIDGEYEGYGPYEEENASDEEDEPPPPPPPEEEKELLFLIEFLVDSMTINTENVTIEGIDPCALQGPVCLELAFLHFPPMLLNELDVDPNKRTGGEYIKFNSGKSLMFALTESQFEEPPEVYMIITATKQMPHAFRFERLPIGKTKIYLTDLFKQVFEKYDENPDKTVSKSIKDNYELMGEWNNKPTGTISIYCRLTCIGENITTEFHKPEDPEKTWFKAENDKIYECKETGAEYEVTKGQAMPGWGDSNKTKCGEPESFLPPSSPEDEGYEQIYAEINGSSIVINLEKNKRKEPPKPFHVEDFCDCNIPLPENLVAGMSDLSLSPASESSLPLVTAKPMPTDKRVAMDCANQLKFPVPPIETLAMGNMNDVRYKVFSCHEKEQHGHKDDNNFQITTERKNQTDSGPQVLYDGPTVKLPNDPDKDVFILRIIKRGRKDSGKNNLELELRVPKEKIERPKKLPYMKEASTSPGKKGNGNGKNGQKKGKK